MKLVTKLLLFTLFITLQSFELLACEIKKEITIGLYSGPMTELIKKLELSHSPQITFHSNYFPIKNKNSTELSGGLFTSKKKLKELAINTVFLDESRDLQQLFASLKIENQVIIKSSGKTPWTVVSENIQQLLPFVSGCEDKIKKLNLELSQAKLDKFSKKKLIFFLGEIKNEKLPPMIMLNDGFVKYLIDENLIKSYKSELAYVTWSEKLIREYEKNNYIFIGLVYGKEKFKAEKLSETQYNIYCQGCLLPGLTQVEFLQDLSRYQFN